MLEERSVDPGDAERLLERPHCLLGVRLPGRAARIASKSGSGSISRQSTPVEYRLTAGRQRRVSSTSTRVRAERAHDDERRTDAHRRLDVSRSVAARRVDRPTVDITGFEVEATDGSIGKVDEATYETGRSFLVVDTGPWIFGKKVMLPAGVIRSIDETEEKVFVNRTKDEIKRLARVRRLDDGRRVVSRPAWARTTGRAARRYRDWDDTV